MNRAPFLLSFFALAVWGCGSNGSKQEAPSPGAISYEIDTVQVDAGDDFIFVEYRLTYSDIDPRNKLLYNYNYKKHQLEVLDLKNLRLKSIIPLEKEGPNGVGRGSFVLKINHLPDESIQFFDFLGFSQLDSTGTKTKDLQLNTEEIEGLELDPDQSLDLLNIASADGENFVSFYQENVLGGKKEGLVLFNISEKSGKKIPTDYMEFSEGLTVQFQMPSGGFAIMPEKEYLLPMEKKIILSSSAINTIWWLDLKTDSIYSKTYESQLTANRKKGNFPLIANSNEEFMEAQKQKEREVNFGPLFFDSTQDIYWRLSTDLDRVTASDSSILKSVLTVFNKDLNQLDEMLLPDDFQLDFNNKIFFLDGMIWMFLNIDDEVAFVRLKPTISYE